MRRRARCDRSESVFEIQESRLDVRTSFYIVRLNCTRHYMTEHAVEIENVTKRYAEHVAVRDLTLRIPKGCVYGLLGPNGRARRRRSA